MSENINKIIENYMTNDTMIRNLRLDQTFRVKLKSLTDYHQSCDDCEDKSANKRITSSDSSCDLCANQVTHL